MSEPFHEHPPAIPCGFAAFAQCIQRQHAQGIEHVGTAEPEREGMFFEQVHAACSVAGDLGIRRHMRIRRGIEDPDGRTAPDRSARVRFQQIVRILTTTVGQACAGAKAGRLALVAKLFCWKLRRSAYLCPAAVYRSSTNAQLKAKIPVKVRLISPP